MGNRKLGLLIILAVVIAFISGLQFEKLKPADSPINSSDKLYEYITNEFSKSYYYNLDEDQKKLAYIEQMYAIVNTYSTLNNDPYTQIVVDNNEAPRDEERFVGLGITYQFENKNLRVVDIRYNSPAFGNLYINDLITGMIINDKELIFEDASTEASIMDHLRGNLGGTKTFIIENGDGQTRVIDVEYNEILTPSAYTVDLEEDNIFYIKINQFSSYIPNVSVGTAEVFKDILLQLEETYNNENSTLILDLRNNPGGALSSLSNEGSTGLRPGIVQQLIERTVEPLFYLENNEGKKSHFYGGLNTKKQYDIKVLVNGLSASAAEVLAASLSESGYDLYGSNTYGKGVYQNTKYLISLYNTNYLLKYTEGKWYYGNNLNVETDQLKINEINQEGIKTVLIPIYYNLLKEDDVDLNLILFQKFLNYYYDENIREDGYFDQNTKSLVLMFQEEFNLEKNGEIDYETYNKIHDLYFTLYNDINNDIQLMNLIDLIKNDE